MDLTKYGVDSKSIEVYEQAKREAARNKPMIGYVKRAVIRKQGYPIGQSAPCHINCVCNARLDLQPQQTEDVTCECGLIYFHNGVIHGWIKNPEIIMKP